MNDKHPRDCDNYVDVAYKQQVDPSKRCPKCKTLVFRRNNQIKLYCRCGKAFCFFCEKEGCNCANNSVGPYVPDKKFGEFGDLGV